MQARKNLMREPIASVRSTYLKQKGHMGLVRLEARRHHVPRLQHRGHLAREGWVVDVDLGEPNGTLIHSKG